MGKLHKILTQTVLLLIIIFSSDYVYSQSFNSYIKKIELISADSVFCTDNNIKHHNNENKLIFGFNSVNEEFILRVYPNKNAEKYSFNLKTTSDYDVKDSVFFINDSFYQTKIQFTGIVENPRLSLKIDIYDENKKFLKTIEVPLYPIANMKAEFTRIPEEIFVGEEANIEILSNLPENVKIPTQWVRCSKLNYRFSRQRNRLITTLYTTNTGNVDFEIFLDLHRPVKDSLNNLSYKYGPLNVKTHAKDSRLAFLDVDNKEIVFDNSLSTKGIKVQLDYNPQLKMQHTYRIEAQEQPGGHLIADIYTKSRLANNKVLCILRVYNFHTQSDGFLYIKDGDNARFITNFSIIPLTEINELKIMRDGSSWHRSNILYPGEEVLLRIEGKSLKRANLTIEDLQIKQGDTILYRDDLIELKAKVPMNIRRRNLQILNNNETTGKSFNIREYNKLREFDYIKINYGKGDKNINEITGPIFYNQTIKDIVFSFDHDKIDSDNMHGVQSVDFNIRLSGRRGEVIEVLNLNDIKVAPGVISPRYTFYDRTNTVTRINLNQFLRRKTYDLEDWAQIKIEIKPSDGSSRDRHAKSYKKNIDIIVQKKYKFDIDVSFPAGLITKKLDGETGYGNLSGISMAMIAQFSFYQKNKIARYKPFKIGAGFIAINALNFSETANRDMGIVIIGSLLPTTRDTRMTFPLYFGGGYLLNDEQWFVLLGPGIRVRF